MSTNIKENGFEQMIVDHLCSCCGYEEGKNADYNKEYAIDEVRLFRFLETTQPDSMEKLGIRKSHQKYTQFLNRLQGEIAKRGIIDVLRKGIKVYPVDLVMFYLTPTAKNVAARKMFEQNIFSVTRQLMYSKDATRLALDLCVFINGLPVITFELKNQLTKQNVDDAVYQYQHDRDPKELLFQFKRCMVHFAVDDAQIKFCTKLDGKASWFLPFNKGYKDGAGNPPNPDGIMTDYLWKDILTKQKLARIIENYAQVVEKEDPDTKKKTYTQVFPRYHQLDVVERLLADVKANGIGQRYLIQHSAGSGKSNSITWLAHQLIGLESDDGELLVDSVIVVTDRVVLDKQIRDNIKQFMQVSSTVAWAEHSSDLRKAIQAGKRIIITTVEKFPFVLSDIGTQHKDNRFAIIIDEAHSGQSGRTSAKMNLALSGLASEEEQDNEDKINAMCEGRKLLKNASYFAFTATPKNKTLETFGTPYREGDKIKHRPFHVYTMKQAIQEGFILDVLKYYTPIDSFYRLKKTVEDDPLYDKKKAQKKLRAFVENQSFTVEQKAEIMVSHFHEQVIAKGKIGGKARAMIITSNIERCIEYYYAVNRCLAARHSPYKAIIAFSGEKEFHDQQPALTSAGLNGFLGAILPYGNPDWEKLSIFLNLLIPKLPSPPEDDFTQGILEAIDLDSYRLEAKECISLVIQDEDAEVAPVPTGQIGAKKEPEMDLLSAILTTFNDMFGNIDWNDADNVRRQILEIPAMVSKDEHYQNAMKNSDKQNARIESERALQQVIFSIMADNMELFKQFQDNPDFKKWLSDLVFNLTYNKDGKPYQTPSQN